MKNRVNILMVDDEPANLAALEAILENSGQNLIKASSGKEALRYVLEPHIDAGGTFRILWPSGRNPSPKVKAFVDFMSHRLFARKG